MTDQGDDQGDDQALPTPMVHTEVTDGVATLTLDDPRRRNALSSGLVEALVDAMERVEADDGVGAVVITGAPPAFCAGADLSDLGRSRRDGLEVIYEGFLRVARSPLPTVAAVNGPAVGAGFNLALACDIRVASISARFDCRFLSLGIHPGGGHTWMLRRLVGPERAAAMVLFGEVVGGAAASAWGLATDCVADDELVTRSTELAARAAAVPTELAKRTKATLTAMADVATHDEAVELELETQLWSMDQPAFAERVAARQRRPPKG